MVRFRTSKKSRQLLAVAFAVAVVAAVLVSAALGSAKGHKSAASTAPAPLAITNAGLAISSSALGLSDEQQLKQMTLPGKREFATIYRLATRADMTFYRIANNAGPDCYAAGAAGSSGHLFDQIACVPDFPSVTTPVLDMTIGPGYQMMGIATNAVTSIAVRDQADQTIAEVPVVDNVYVGTPSAKPAAAKLVALGASSVELYTAPEPH
jgi:hypothetical protein